MSMIKPIDPVESAHSGIRACVAAPGYLTYFTWYFSGNVVRIEDGEAEQAERAYSVEGFNRILQKHGVAPLLLPGEERRKRPERMHPP